MKTFKCDEMMCEGCVARINKALDGAQIGHTVDLASKTVSVEGGESEWRLAVELLDDLGFSAVETA